MISYHLSMKTVISERGQITVPKAIRDRLGLSPGTTLEMDFATGGFVARKIANHSPWREALGVIRRMGGTDSTDKIIDELRGSPDAVQDKT
jgi:antitoxin PrlF